jgi:hypothetical protein
MQSAKMRGLQPFPETAVDVSRSDVSQVLRLAAVAVEVEEANHYLPQDPLAMDLENLAPTRFRPGSACTDLSVLIHGRV